MKKVLLATSALTLLAGAAAADVTIGGTSRMGITSTGGNATTSYRTRLNVSLSGETDGGLSFGAFTRMQMGNAATGTISGSNVWVSNGMATLTIGNAGGATSATGAVFGCGVGFLGTCQDLANGLFSWTSFSSGGAGSNVARLDFALGSANLSISGGNGNDTEVAMSYSAGNMTIAVSHDAGIGTATTSTNVGAAGGTQVRLSFDAGSANVSLQAARDTASGLNGAIASVSYGIGGGTLYAFAGTGIYDSASGASVTVATGSAFGLSYSQSLGGGATAKVSAASIGGTATYSAGMNFSF